MKKIRSSKKGFTLAELLIVVAIIGVLVGISIPIFTTQLEKSREATDIANMRAAKAAITAKYLDDSATGTFYYDAEAGVIKTAAPSVKYGKGTTAVGSDANKFAGYTATTEAKDKVIKIVVSVNDTTKDAEFAYSWE